MLKNSMENKIIILLRKNPSGLTITEIVNKTKLSRSGVRSSLARLEGGKKVSFRKIGMAKVYILR
jgi:DNA-binding IclR family transcriptional regulator